MPDSSLVTLKKTLNTVVPQVLDRGHTALTLNENANDPAFLRTYSNSIETIQKYLRSAGADLQMLAGTQSNLLTAVQVTGELDQATLSAITMLQTSARADAGRVGPGVKQLISMFNDIAQQTQALPEYMRRTVNTESKRLFAARSTVSPSPKSPDQQAQDFMKISDSYLGVSGNPETNKDVLENTGRALKDYLKTQKAANPDIKAEFVPQIVDVRTAAFMNELLQKRMREAGVKPENLQATLLQLWMMQQRGEQHPNPAMQELGRVGAMKGLVDYVVGGRLPSGDFTGTRPRTDSPWENPVRDRFFNRAVYADLLNSDSVSAQSLLRPANDADPAQQELIRSIAQRLGYDLNAQRFTRDQVGAIATEIMVHQAKKLCIEERDISAAMMEGRFNPHMDDVFLAKIGMGKPPRDQQRVEQLERIGILPEQQHDIYFRTQFDRYRDQKWTDRFGGVSDQHIFRLAQRLKPDLIPQNTDLKYEDLRNDPNVRDLMEKVRASGNSSPAALFEWAGRGRNDPFNFQEMYRRLREDRYLPGLREKANENKLDLCSTGPGTGGGSGARPGASPPTGGTGTCFADDMDGPCKPAGRPATPASGGDCYADDFKRACGPEGGNGGDRIRSNAADATGQPVTPDTGCYADDMAGPCKTPQVTQPVR